MWWYILTKLWLLCSSLHQQNLLPFVVHFAVNIDLRTPWISSSVKGTIWRCRRTHGWHEMPTACGLWMGNCIEMYTWTFSNFGFLMVLFTVLVSVGCIWLYRMGMLTGTGTSCWNPLTPHQTCPLEHLPFKIYRWMSRQHNCPLPRSITRG